MPNDVKFDSIWDIYEHKYVIEGVDISISGFFLVTASNVIWVK
jgi:hypothetical protein